MEQIVSKESHRYYGFLHAALVGDTETVRSYIESGADVNSLDVDNNSPLIFAATNAEVDIVNLLLNNGADVNIKGSNKQTALHVAADVNKGVKRRTGLHMAALGNKLTCVILLLKAGADVNALDIIYQSPIFYATFHPDICQALLEAGADVNIIGDELRTPILTFIGQFRHADSLKDATKCIQLLLSKGAHVNFRLDRDYIDNLRPEVCVLLSAAGHRRFDEKQHQGDPSLPRMCRNVIRRHLLSVNNINLLVRVPQLPLPAALKRYLLYDVTLDDIITDDVTLADDVTQADEVAQADEFTQADDVTQVNYFTLWP